MEKYTIQFKFKGTTHTYSTRLSFPIDTDKKHRALVDFIHDCYEDVGVTDEKQTTCRVAQNGDGRWYSYIAGTRKRKKNKKGA